MNLPNLKSVAEELVGNSLLRTVLEGKTEGKKQEENRGCSCWDHDKRISLHQSDQTDQSYLLTYIDLIPPVPNGASGDELSPSGTTTGSFSRVTPIHTHLF